MPASTTSGWWIANAGPAARMFSSLSVTTVAISMIASLSGFNPVISRSIQMRLSPFDIAMPSHPSADGAPAGEGMRKRAAVDVLQLAAHGHAVGDAARAHAEGGGNLAQEVRRRYPFHRR